MDYTETIRPIFTKLGGKVAHGPRKKPLDFGGNLDHVTLGLGLWGRDTIVVRWGTTMLCVNGCFFNYNNFAISAALAEACALLSAILVKIF